MAYLVTGQGTWPLIFSDDYVASGATGRIDYVIRTDDVTFNSNVEYKIYINASSSVASYFATLISVRLYSYTQASSSAMSYTYNSTDRVETSISVTPGKDTLIASGTMAAPAMLYNSSTGLPFYKVGLEMLLSIEGSSGTRHSVSTEDCRDNLVTLTAAISPSTISSSAGFLGEPVTINLVHKISGVYANITYKIGNATGYVANGVTASSINWTLPSELIVEFGEDEIQKEMILTCDSYISGVLLGTTQAKLTAFLPSTELTPVMNPTVKDINPATVALTGNDQCFVRYKSIAEYAINAAAVKGAKIVKQQVKNGTYVVDNIPSGTIPNIETDTFEFLAIDNRDMGTSTSIFTQNFVEYIKLTCNQKIHMEVSGETGAVAIVKIFGNYYKGSFGAQDNTLKVEIQHTNNDGNLNDWVDISSFSDVKTTNGTYEVDFNISGLRYDITYTFKCRVTDKLEQVTTKEYVLKVMPVFDWSEDDFNFNVPVSVHGSMTFDSNRTITLGDCSIENEGGTISINADTINLNAPNVAFNNVDLMNIDNGTWTPVFASSAAIASYSSQEGWYQKIGNTVTIGFNLSAICKSGYTSTSLAIKGVPFAPVTTAFGGGVASRTHVSAGFNFQCWAIGTSGEITGRVQGCNNTSNGALTTSASGLFYGAQDISITVGGTITYITND